MIAELCILSVGKQTTRYRKVQKLGKAQNMSEIICLDLYKLVHVKGWDIFIVNMYHQSFFNNAHYLLHVLYDLFTISAHLFENFCAAQRHLVLVVQRILSFWLTLLNWHVAPFCTIRNWVKKWNTHMHTSGLRQHT